MESTSDVDVLTTEDLRNKLFDLLKNKGLVNKLKSQLRNQLVVELKGVGLSHAFDRGSTNGFDGESLPLRAVNSLIADHMKNTRYDYTLSVFLPESGLSQDKLLTTKDLLQLLRISSQSKLYKRLSDATRSHQEGFLWRLIVEVANANGRPVLENGTQTEHSRLPSTSIEEEFRKVDSYYSNLEDGSMSRVVAVEERILSYQRLLEERSRSELHMAIARFKDNEMARLKIEERENSRKEVEKSRKEVSQKI